jgi:CHAD domain-containing protein
MAFRFKLDQSLRVGFRRIAREQFDTAVAALEGEGVTPERVHACRKSIKRLRALVRLVEPAIGNKQARLRNLVLRDTARLLSQQRDEAVVIATIHQLEQSAGEPSKAAFAALRQVLGHRAEDAPSPLDGALAARARKRLIREAQRFANLEFKARDFTPLRAGLEASYRAGRRALARARQQPSSDTFHELRKTVQWHWRQMSLLERAWPEIIGPRIAEARELSQCLGDDHDLAILEHVVTSQSSLTDETRAEILALCHARQAALRQTAQLRAERLFADRPAHFAGQMAVYWAAAIELDRVSKAVRRAGKDQPGPAEAPAGPASAGPASDAAVAAKTPD